jgi:hypothetical protein
MKTNLQKDLTLVAPSISIETIWEPDPYARFDELDLPGEDPDDWQPWQSEVRASAIVEGELLSGSAYLSGTWEKYLDKPWISNPEISGYENQMIVEALEDLEKSGRMQPALVLEIHNAIARCQYFARLAHEASRKLETTN